MSFLILPHVQKGYQLARGVEEEGLDGEQSQQQEMERRQKQRPSSGGSVDAAINLSRADGERHGVL